MAGLAAIGAWLTAKLVFLKPLVAPLKWLVQLSGWIFKFREHSDQRKLAICVPKVQRLMATIRMRHLSAPTSPQRGTKLLEAVIAASQPIVTEFAGESLLTIKSEDPQDHGFLACIYAAPEALPERFEKFIRQLPKIPKQPSYAGLALKEKRTIIESDLNRRKESDKVAFSDDVKAAIKSNRIAGLAVQPIFVPMQEEPVAVLKIDFLEYNGLVDNAPTQAMLSLLAEFFGYAFQVMMMECPEASVTADQDPQTAETEEHGHGGTPNAVDT